MTDDFEIRPRQREHFIEDAEMALWGMGQIISTNHGELRHKALNYRENGDITYLAIASELSVFRRYGHIPLERLGIFVHGHYETSTSDYLIATAGVLDTNNLLFRRKEIGVLFGEEENSLTYDLYDSHKQMVDTYSPERLANVIEIGLQLLADTNPD